MWTLFSKRANGSADWSHNFSKKRLRQEIFLPFTKVCLVHGDTPSTLIGAIFAKRAGLKIAHLESGLRSGIINPFPEEAIE